MTIPTQAQTEATISHDEAKEIASRLIAGAFRREDKRPQFSIPANPDRDDDLRIMAYIEQQAALTAAAQVGEYGLKFDPRWPGGGVNPMTQVGIDYNIDDAPEATVVRLATIERCVQWLKSEALALRSQVSGGDGSEPQWIEARALDRAADAIRKLKDEPAVDPNIIHPGKDPDFTFPEEDQ